MFNIFVSEESYESDRPIIACTIKKYYNRSYSYIGSSLIS